MDNRVDRVSAGGVPSGLRTTDGRRRVTGLGRGSGKLDREPTEQRKTEIPVHGGREDDAGSGSRATRARPREGCLSRRRDPLPTDVAGLPALPRAFDDIIEAGLRASSSAGSPIGPLRPGVRTAIADHVRLLLAWNSAINLTAIRDPADIARLHVLDSLVALQLLRHHAVDRLLDLGSGAGYPGLPLALALPAQAMLVESVGKKAAFLRAVVAALGVDERVAVAAARAESLASLAEHRASWPAVTARAVAPLSDLVELSLPLLATGGILVAWKRGELGPELAAAGRATAALGGARPVTHDVGLAGLEGHRLIVVTKRDPTPTGIPREPAMRRRRPW